MIVKLEVTKRGLTEVNFELLDFVQTADGNYFSIAFKDNENKKPLSKRQLTPCIKKVEL